MIRFVFSCRDAPSSPFRQNGTTRQERMQETILRDTRRVNSINNRINNQMKSTMSTFSHQTKNIPSQDFQAPVISGLSLGSGEYFIRVSVGTPPKSMYLVLDTGSDILWLQCAPCTNCYHQTDAVFDPSRSSSYSPLGCNSRLCLNLDVSGCSANKCLYQALAVNPAYTPCHFALNHVEYKCMCCSY